MCKGFSETVLDQEFHYIEDLNPFEILYILPPIRANPVNVYENIKKFLQSAAVKPLEEPHSHCSPQT